MSIETLVLGFLLASVLAFLSPAVQETARRLCEHRPRRIWAVPALLTALFSGAALLAGAASVRLCLAVLAYTAAPVLCVSAQGPGSVKRPTALDFLAILLLWLPLEFGAGASLVPVPARGFLHSAAYGTAILLGLALFLAFRPFPGLRYNPPKRPADWLLPVIGFAAVAPVLILVGIGIGFIPPPHLPVKSAATMVAAAPLIFAATALPEEILFRALIQNFLELRFGGGIPTLLAASLIFGSAHLDNGPQALPNWRYMIEATIAGIAYGAVFRRASTVLSSAGLHMLVDWTKHFFF
ncbi:MAG TPA: CPBP family intramembrane glutamic endopeptidase [Bryobacteraceae bacterium]|nr:CPBP family intramembrane glutamic endopeptidase [Bryobacteraceae bacterium]